MSSSTTAMAGGGKWNQNFSHKSRRHAFPTPIRASNFWKLQKRPQFTYPEVSPSPVSDPCRKRRNASNLAFPCFTVLKFQSGVESTLMAQASQFDPDRALAHRYPETTYSYTERDAAVYALGVGACGRDAIDADELKFVYHENGQQYIEALPTFAALFSLGSMVDGLNLPGLQFDPSRLLHGPQYIEIYKPLPSNASLINKVSLAGLHDKGKAAILEIETKSYLKESGELLCMNRLTAYLRGAGAFSNSAHPFSYSNYPPKQVPEVKIPKSQPFTVFEDSVQQSQALLYRLSGDYNPQHSDPTIARSAGFSRPILHGLCTLGFAVRAIIKCICKGDANNIKNISGRFLLPVFPGETLITEMWLEGLRVIYQVNVKERKRVVLSGFVDIHRLASSL